MRAQRHYQAQKHSINIASALKMFHATRNQNLSFPKYVLSPVELIQNKDNYPIPANGLLAASPRQHQNPKCSS